MIKIGKRNEGNFLIKAAFKGEKNHPAELIKQNDKITEIAHQGKAFIFLGEKAKFDVAQLEKAVQQIVLLKTRDFDIDVQSFITKKISEEIIIETFVEKQYCANGKLWSAKTKKAKPVKELTLINTTVDKEIFKRAQIVAQARNWTRTLQIMPPNVLTSVTFADEVSKELKKEKNLSVKVLKKVEIQKLKMGLLLSVNLGSKYEPRVVIAEYKGDPSSKEKTVLVGKGITFDAGGYNIKTGRFMAGMKFDMSGAAISAGTMKAIAQLKPKANFSIVLVMTDNMINSEASTPDAVFTSMNGKSVEINNTDAEGRLALADGLTYAIRKLNATRVMDIATLTGAIVSALGSTYTGVWATKDKTWNDLQKASYNIRENIWRMPFHADYLNYMKNSTVADLRNTDYTGKGGSSSAAMFLKEFTEETEYVHFDVAGTADVDHKPKGVMVKTLVEYIRGIK